jgi:chain length determinant protein (polysaccharide antigen chain regulator)
MEQNQLELKTNYDDEIDLFELAETLWEKKWFIVTITGIISVLALVFAFFIAEPVYEASTIIIPPSIEEIKSFNVGRGSIKELVPYTPLDVYKEFLKTAKLKDIQEAFIKDVYLEKLDPKDKELDTIKLLERFQNNFSIKQHKVDELPNAYIISFKANNARLAQEILESYILYIGENSSTKLLLSNEMQITAVIENLDSSLKAVKDLFLEEQENQIIRLEEALVIAKNIGLTKPVFVEGKGNLETAQYVDRNLLYMQGSLALEAQIKALKERTNIEAFAFTDEQLLTKYQLVYLKNLTFTEDAKEVFKLSGSIDIPQNTIAPKKKLILALAFISGLMISVFIVLVQDAIIKRKNQSYNS